MYPKMMSVTAVTERESRWHMSRCAKACVPPRYRSEQLPELAPVALRLLSMHPTSASTEHNWALWGRVYTGARNALGLERVKKLITCFNSRSQEASMEDFALLLSVVKDELVDATNERSWSIGSGMSALDRQAAAAPVVSRQQWGDFGCASTKHTICNQLSERHTWKVWVFICLVMYDLSRSDRRAHCINSLR
jgi:hypothetical protein